MLSAPTLYRPVLVSEANDRDGAVTVPLAIWTVPPEIDAPRGNVTPVEVATIKATPPHTPES
jgi:hypothetical protein